MKTPITRNRPAPARREGVTSDNWIDGPYNRWGFRHVRELTGTARVKRGVGPVRVLPERQGDLGDLMVALGDEQFGFTEALEAVYTDAFVVVHDGEIVHEWYAEGMGADDTHLLMSVSKSLTSTLIGALVGEGLVRTDEFAHTYVPELVGTAWEGATVQHLLDMTAGVDFDESDYDDPETPGCLIEQISGYTTHRRPDLPGHTVEWMLSLPPKGEHGERWEYRSIITDVLAFIAERVTGQRFATVFSERIWSRIGTEHDADLILDAQGFPTVEGGFCATARDLARVGLLHLERGRVGGLQVIPEEWTDRVLTGDPVLMAQFAAGDAADPRFPKAHYHDCWWVIDAKRGRFAGHGINGQHLFVDRSTNTVIAWFSTWPGRMDDDLRDAGSVIAATVLAHLAR